MTNGSNVPQGYSFWITLGKSARHFLIAGAAVAVAGFFAVDNVSALFHGAPAYFALLVPLVVAAGNALINVLKNIDK